MVMASELAELKLVVANTKETNHDPPPKKVLKATV